MARSKSRAITLPDVLPVLPIRETVVYPMAITLIQVGHERSDQAITMTSEITLRGRVLPVGGTKEKVLAAHPAGIRTVVLARRNEGALDDVPPDVRNAFKFVFVQSANEVLAAVLE